MAPRVVVIDDDPAILAMLGEVLALAGYDAVLSPGLINDPAEVVALAPQAILVDLLLGREPRGAQLLGRLLGEPATARIPMIACTGSSRAAQMTAGFLTELHIPLVRKPFAIEHLLAVLRTVVGPAAE